MSTMSIGAVDEPFQNVATTMDIGSTLGLINSVDKLSSAAIERHREDTRKASNRDIGHLDHLLAQTTSAISH